MSTCHSEQSRLCSRRLWTVRVRTVSRFVSTAMALMLFVQAGRAQVLKPRPISVEAYGESYTAVASVDDGGYLLIQYVFTNAGWGDGKAACRILLVEPGAKGRNEAARFDKDEWRYQASTNELKVGKCSLKTTAGKTTFYANTKTIEAALEIDASVKATKTPGHRIKVDSDEFYESEVLIPWAAATVTIKRGGQSAPRRGFAYLDHSRSNTRLPKAAKQWLRFRGFRGAKQVLLEYRQPPEGRTVGWHWSPGGQPEQATGTLAIKFQGSQERPTVSTALGTITTQKKLYAYRPAKEWGMLGKIAKPWVGDPVTTTYAATLKLGDGSMVTGILEHVKITD